MAMSRSICDQPGGRDNLPILMIVFVLGAAFFSCFYGLGLLPLLDNNEGIYAAIAKDMALRDHWIIPHLNGLPYIEKPPLLYWLTACSFKLFGIGEWQARLSGALAFFTTLLAMSWFIHRHAGSRPACLAIFILSTSTILLLLARMVFFDTLLTCFVTLALIALYEWHDSAARKWLRVAYLCTGLAVLAKGLLALMLVGGVLGSFLILSRTPWRIWRAGFDLPGLLLFLIIAAPWHIAASLAEPGFAWFYFINEHLLRFLNLRVPHDYYTGPFWYYIPRLLLLLAPWSLFLPWLWARDESYISKPLQRFLVCWFGFIFLFFSVSLAKANYYLMPAIPPLVMLLAIRLDAGMLRSPRKLQWAGSLMMLTLMGGLFFVFWDCPARPGLQPYCAAFTLPVIVAALLLFLFSLLLIWKGPPSLRWMAPGLLILLLWPFILSGIAQENGQLSQRSVARYLLEHEPDMPTALYRDFEEFSAFAFYLPYNLPVIDSESADLLYGREHHSQELFPTLGEWLVRIRASGKPARLVTNNRYAASLQERLQELPVRGLTVDIQRFTRVSVVTLRP